MAIVNMMPHPGGGTETETTLWTSSSTSSAAFTATLSQAATNFDRIRIYYYLFGADSPAAIELKVDDLTTFTGGTNTGMIALGAKGSSYNYSRFGQFASNMASISFTTAYRAGASNTSNTYCLPYQISGIKSS